MDKVQTITDYVTKFLSEFGFPDPITPTVAFDPADNRYLISLHAPEPSLLIGHHGENLTALQFMLGQHLNTLLGAWVNISLNVNDYQERHERTLYDLADTTVADVLGTHQPYALPPLSAADRRLIHVYLSAHPQVVTSSEGVGRDRTLIISPKV